MMAASIAAEPGFEYSEEKGSYALSATSPCVDAGWGSPDPDGSPNDIGAFGGPEGDWWRSFPWQLP